MKNTTMNINYKFFLAFILLTIMVVISGCQEESDKVTKYAKNFEITGDEKEKLLASNSPNVFTSVSRDDSHIEPIVIDPVDKDEEITVQPGRYTLTGNATGNAYIYDEDGELVFHSILGNFYGVYGVNTITLDIAEGYTLKFDGLDVVNISPAFEVFDNMLTAGIWDVGIDIESGEYLMSAPEGFGYVQILEENNGGKIYEVIGGEYAQTKSNVQLKEGQKIKITDISRIEFTPK